MTFCNTTDDVRWLKDTALNGVTLPTEFQDFKSFVISGNEDAPDIVELFLSDDPNIEDKHIRVTFPNDGLVYCYYNVIGE